MPMTPAEIDRLMKLPEDQHLEFKGASRDFNLKKLCEYSVAFANEGGGRLIFGISDKMPREVIGTQAYLSTAKTAASLYEALNFRVDVEAVQHPSGRVVIFDIPPRPAGVPRGYKGKFLMRSGESLVPMSADQLAKIFNEDKPDWLMEYSKTDLTSQKILDILDIENYFKLREYSDPTNQASAIDRLVKDGIIYVQNGAYSIPRLSALALAKKLRDFPELEHKTPRIIVYDGISKVKTRIDRKWSKGYASGFQSMIRFIMSRLPQNEAIVDGLRRKVSLVPEISIREFVANALVHQDFSIQGNSARVEIYDNRVEISNPGDPVILIDRFIDGEKSRNEKLTSLMRRLGICEERGSGVDKAISQIEFFQLPAPDFRKNLHGTSVVIHGPRKFEKMYRKDRIRACYHHCVLRYVMGEAMNNESLRIRFGLPEDKRVQISQLITATVGERLIKLDDKAGTSRKYARYLPNWA